MSKPEPLSESELHERLGVITEAEVERLKKLNDAELQTKFLNREDDWRAAIGANFNKGRWHEFTCTGYRQYVN